MEFISLPRIRIIIDNKDVIIDKEETWQQVASYINNTWSWFASRPKLPTFFDPDDAGDTDEKTDSKTVFEPAIEETWESAIANTSSNQGSSKNHVFRPRSPLGKRAIDYMIKALIASGGRCQKDQCYKIMASLGYIAESADPIRILHDKVRRRYNHLVEVDGDDFVLLKPGYDLGYSLSANGQVNVSDTQQPGVSLPEGIDNAQPIIPKTDQILLAVNRLGGRAHIQDAVSEMLRQGWQTPSNTPDKRRRTVWATIKHNPDLMEIPVSGHVAITPAGYRRLESIRQSNPQDSPANPQNSPASDFEESRTELFAQV